MKTKTSYPWERIKVEYLKGIPPRELSKKYQISASRISVRASQEGWRKEGATLKKNLKKKMDVLVEKEISKKLTTVVKNLTDELENILGSAVSLAKGEDENFDHKARASIINKLLDKLLPNKGQSDEPNAVNHKITVLNVFSPRNKPSLPTDQGEPLEIECRPK